MNELDKVQAIERANSYREMMNSWSWKDFYTNILGEIKKDAITTAMTGSGSLETTRGKYQAIEAIESQLDYILNGATK